MRDHGDRVLLGLAGACYVALFIMYYIEMR